MNLVPEIHEDVLRKSIARARERNIILPTFAQQKDPTLVPDAIAKRLRQVGLWDLDPANLFRITWKNQAVANGGGFGEGNWIEFPSSLTGIDATIVGIVGKWFPTGAHKVGAAYSCLVPRLVTVLLIRTRKRPCGRPPVTTAVVGPTTAPCSPALL